MHVVIVNRHRVPVFAYGGTERIVWDLGRGLAARGHTVSLLVPPGSTSDFARVLPYDRKAPIRPQIPPDVDIVHFQFSPADLDPDEELGLPYLMTEHANPGPDTSRPLNTVFISADQARRNHSDQVVHNGLNWDDYGPVDLGASRRDLHFLAKASRRVKNLAGAISVAGRAGCRLDVLGGRRLNLSRRLSFNWSPRARFHGMVGGRRKAELLNGSAGLVFPVLWPEPFGLAVIESLYFGCPVFATPYGSLPELVPAEVGYLSASARDLAEAVKAGGFSARRCHEFARERFSAEAMATGYLAKYEQILNGRPLHARRPYVGGHGTGHLPWRDD